ncbi:MAG: hypothetical protein H7281_16125 [Bacteriovorax sp.]|nr:hypothetical protein [Bacteriovorax sp.]
MNYKVLIIICILNFLNIANCSTASINDYKFDQVHIALHTPTSPKSGLLKEPLKIFDNISLKGDPVFIVDNEQVKSNLIKSVAFKYDDYFKYNSGGNSIIKIIPIDFITLLPTGFALSIESYSSGVAILKDKKNKYFIKISPSSFVLNNWPEHSWWPKTDNSTSTRKYLSDTLLKDKKFEKLILSIRQCVEDKSSDCLAGTLATGRDIFKEDVLKLNVAKNEVLCTKWKSGSDTSDLSSQVKIKDVAWDLYQKAFSFKDYDTKYSMTTFGFGQIITIDIFREGNTYCDGKLKEMLMVSLVFSKDQGSWDFYSSQVISED